MMRNLSAGTSTDLVETFLAGKITGKDLALLVANNEITKSERRKITKIVKQRQGLTDRQRQRLEVKAKKSLPKISREERRQRIFSKLELEREQNKDKFTVCLGCRKKGHALKNCPNKKDDVNICFNCGSADHALRHCQLPKDSTGYLPYSKCFYCNKMGHLSRDCPENPNGLYPHGGCCHICLQKVIRFFTKINAENELDLFECFHLDSFSSRLSREN